eukprot:SAG31_NODE_2652_length_5296_cov_7.770637_3_plen_87_part_00
MVGEGVGCDLTLSCESGQISGVLFADWGLPYAVGGGAALPLPLSFVAAIDICISVSCLVPSPVEIGFHQHLTFFDPSFLCHAPITL